MNSEYVVNYISIPAICVELVVNNNIGVINKGKSVVSHVIESGETRFGSW